MVNGYDATCVLPLDNELINADLPTFGDPATTIQGSLESIEGNFLKMFLASPNHRIWGEIWSIIDDILP